MSILRYSAGILCSLCLMIISLITSAEAVACWIPGYYEKGHTKYSITADVDMEMGGLLDMTKETVAFLQGDRTDLHVEITVGGVQREFFNEREIAHVVGVQGLLLTASMIQKICLAVAAVCVITLFLLKSNVKKILPKSICIGTGLFFALICVLAGVISADFNKCSVIFYHTFFNNDLRILDPTTNLFVNIVPESFFMDTVARIALIYGVSILILSPTCFFCLRRQKR